MEEKIIYNERYLKTLDSNPFDGEKLNKFLNSIEEN